MHEYTFSIRQIINYGCSGVCLMQVEARNKRDAEQAAARKARRMGMTTFVIVEVC